MAEIDLLIGTGDETDPKADAVPEIDPVAPPVSRLGDLWLCTVAVQIIGYRSSRMLRDARARSV